MNDKLMINIIVYWLILVSAIIYFNVTHLNEGELLSKCHNASIKIYYDRPMCTECKLFCEVVK